ncbi:MAG: d(CMP) kinase [Planctomycetota bacterium]|nr:d(CMP) kinase [Planctomycetota bacterium]
MQPLIITLDGPAGSGKSTVARRLAQRLGLEFLDTGAMYRGLTAHCLDHGIDPAGEAALVVEFLRPARLRFNWKADPPRLHIQQFAHGHAATAPPGVTPPAGESDITPRLRDQDVTLKVSDIAAIGAVRHMMVDAQRDIARTHPRLVTEGRDQGSVVFPDAQMKFYLDARPQVRARRRAEQLAAAGKPADPDQIVAQILRRDHRDVHRADGPLICPGDAVRVDTSEMSLDQVVEHLEERVRQAVSPDVLEGAPAARPAGGGR